MRRATVILGRDENIGYRVEFLVPDTFREFFFHVQSYFNIATQGLGVYHVNGCEYTDLRCIRDGDKVFLYYKPHYTGHRGFNPPGGIPYDEMVELIRVMELLNTDLPGTSRGPPRAPRAPSASYGRPAKNPETEPVVLEDEVVLNVGGKHLTTSRRLVAEKIPNSMLNRMLKNPKYYNHPNAKDDTGAFKLDRSPEFVEPLINYLRTGTLDIGRNLNPRGVLAEVLYLGFDELIPNLVNISSRPRMFDPRPQSLSREDILAVMSLGIPNHELRFQGLDFNEGQLGGMDLSHINFRSAKLSGCNFTNTRLSFSSLEEADLSGVMIRRTDLSGVNARRACFDESTWDEARFTGPAGRIASFDHISMNGGLISNTVFRGVNFYRARLSNVTISHCDLRYIDLNNCRLYDCSFRGCAFNPATSRGISSESSVPPRFRNNRGRWMRR